MNTRLLLVVGAAAAIVGATGLSAYADLLQDIVGIIPGGSTAPLAPAAISDTDPVPPGAQKTGLFASPPFGATCPDGATVTGDQFGFVVLNTSGSRNSKVKAQIVIKNGIPNVAYEIYLDQHPGDCGTPSGGTILTDGQGNGNGSFVETRVPGSTRFWMNALVNDAMYFPSNPKSLLRSVAVSLD